MTQEMTLNIPENEWEAMGYDCDPTARLLVLISINGLDMHLEAFAIDKVDEMHWDIYDGVSRAVERADFATTVIGNRKYVLIATPFFD